MEPIIELSNVSAGYQYKPVFQNISLKIVMGTFTGIVGPTGSGKTTLLKTMLGTMAPLAGTIKFLGQNVHSRKRGSIGYVPQLETVDWSFPVTVEQVVLMGFTDGNLWPWPTREEKKRTRSIAEKLGIDAYLHHHIRDLSGGQQQRVFLARALVGNPRLLVLDEPTAGVDIKTQHDVLHLLGDINKEGVSIILTTHDLNAVAAHLPWVICFNKALVSEGNPKDVFTEEVLNETYGGSITIVKHKGHLLIANSAPLSL